MAEPHAEELASLRHFVEGLESGATTLRRNGVDVTKREAAILRREIADLEQLIIRLKSGGHGA
jgi:polyhydroxyalkanoate synthesis regulator phasin